VVVSQIDSTGLLLSAAIDGYRATGMKMATGGRIERTRLLTFEYLVRCLFWYGLGDGCQEGLGVRMSRISE
jgi:hypothetical protein